MSKLLIIYRGLAISKDFPYVPLGQGLSAKGRLSAKGKLSFLFVKYLFVYLFETIRERGREEGERENIPSAASLPRWPKQLGVG